LILLNFMNRNYGRCVSGKANVLADYWTEMLGAEAEQVNEKMGLCIPTAKMLPPIEGMLGRERNQIN